MTSARLVAYSSNMTVLPELRDVFHFSPITVQHSPQPYNYPANEFDMLRSLEGSSSAQFITSKKSIKYWQCFRKWYVLHVDYLCE